VQLTGQPTVLHERASGSKAQANGVMGRGGRWTVVVMKFWPVKPVNGVEGKTRNDRGGGSWGALPRRKRGAGSKGGSKY